MTQKTLIKFSKDSILMGKERTFSWLFGDLEFDQLQSNACVLGLMLDKCTNVCLRSYVG